MNNTVRLVFDCYAVGVGITTAGSLRSQALFRATHPGRPVRLFGMIPLPPISGVLFSTVGCLFIVTLFLAATGVAVRWLVALALIFYFLYFSQIIQLSYIGRKTNLIPIFLAIFLVTPGLTEPLSAVSPTWPLVATQAVVALVYFSAAVAKIRNSGWHWASGGPFRAYLQDNFFWRESRITWRAAQSPGLCALMSRYTIGVEAFFPLAIVSPLSAALFVAAAVAMHLGAHLLMGINYLRYWWANYIPYLVPIAMSIARRSALPPVASPHRHKHAIIPAQQPSRLALPAGQLQCPI